MTKKTSKSPVEARLFGRPLKQGEQVVGPGVVKRPKREQAAVASSTEELSYKPSEQVFRRR